MFACKLHFLKRELFLFSDVSDGVARMVLLEAYKTTWGDTVRYMMVTPHTSPDRGWCKVPLGRRLQQADDGVFGRPNPNVTTWKLGWRKWWWWHLEAFTTDSSVEEVKSRVSLIYPPRHIGQTEHSIWRSYTSYVCVSSRNWCDTWCNIMTFLNKIQYIKIYYYEMENNLWTLLGSYILHKCVSQLKIYTFSFHFQGLFLQISDFDSSKIEQI